MIGRMKKKTLILFLSLFVCALYGCTNSSTETSESFESAKSAPIIQEVETLSDAEIIIPAALIGDEIWGKSLLYLCFDNNKLIKATFNFLKRT